jgi:hypothetical protein
MEGRGQKEEKGQKKMNVESLKPSIPESFNS